MAAQHLVSETQNIMQLEINDIQGLVIRGYSNLPAADFLILSITDGAAAKKWLADIQKDITAGHQKPKDIAVHIAFSFEGLKQLGLDRAALNSFPMELEDGMTTRHKQQFLGDFGNSAPDNWEWGGRSNEPVHILLMIYAKDAETLDARTQAYLAQVPQSGLKLLTHLGTTVLYERKEHFGFRDGISQPTIKGLSRSDSDENCVEPGEFILGYKNGYDQFTPSPYVAPAADPKNLLPKSSVNGMRDLGKNGTYIVFRQMKQDVSLFWKYMDKATQNTDGSTNEPAMIKLAAQMVGRWPNGTPIVVCPDGERPHMEDDNNFDFRNSDPHGLKCPFASHIRRSNPKDSLDTDRKTSISVSNKHRILRRGRSYGPPIAETLKPIDCLNATKCDDDRGLHFICLGADIGRQFEFVQNAWINNPKFNGLYEERDAITGNHHNPQDPRTTGTFAVQHPGLRVRYTDIPEFVTIRGGAYFFMPGIKALQYLSSL